MCAGDTSVVLFTEIAFMIAEAYQAYKKKLSREEHTENQYI